MVEWEDGEVTTWSEVTYESGLVIPKDQLEQIIRKALPESFRKQSIMPTNKEVSINCFYESGLTRPQSDEDTFAGISVHMIVKRSA